MFVRSRSQDLQTLAAAGVASRRAAEDLIFAGRVLVNGKKESLPQRKVVPGKDKVCLTLRLNVTLSQLVYKEATMDADCLQCRYPWMGSY